MDKKLFKRLGSTAAEYSWEHVRKAVIKLLMGKGVFSVPYLRDAPNYAVGHVILKSRRSFIEKLMGKKSTVIAAGPLSKYVKYGLDPVQYIVERMSYSRQDEQVRLDQAFEYFNADSKNGENKSVTVHVFGCHKWKIDFIPSAGDFAVDLIRAGYKDFDRLYLITEAFYVNEVKIRIVIDGKADDFNIRGNIPIGFCLTRYTVGVDGTLGKPKKYKRTNWNAEWVRQYMNAVKTNRTKSDLYLNDKDLTKPRATSPTQLSDCSNEEEEDEVPEQTSEPEVSEPEKSEPEVIEPENSEPEVSEPENSEPENSEPEVSQVEVDKK